MKHTLLILFLIASVIKVFAQSANKSAALRQRLIAKTWYDRDSTGNFIPQDSVHFTYSGLRHSQFDNNILDFDDYYHYEINADLFATPAVMNNVDSNRFANKIPFDSMDFYAYWPPLFRDNLQTCSYNSDGTLNEVKTTWHYRGVPQLTRHAIVDYKAGKMSRIYDDHTGMRYIEYDAKGLVTTDSVAVYGGYWMEPYSRTTYSYDATGHYTVKLEEKYFQDSNRMFPVARYVNTYYPDGRLKTRLNAPYWVHRGFPEIGSIDSFGYTAGVQGYTSIKSTDLDTFGNPTGVYRYYDAHVDANLRKDYAITTSVEYGNVVSSLFTGIIYNSYGNPASRVFYDLTKIPALPQEQVFYYYETYDAPSSVTNVENASPVISLSPNPTSGTITLHYLTSLPKAPIRVVISNMMGQLVHSESFVPQGSSANVTMSDGAAPGIYSICVYGEGGSMLYKGVFVKR